MKNTFVSSVVFAALATLAFGACTKEAAPSPALVESKPAAAAATPDHPFGDKTPAQALDEAMKIALDTVYFEFDSSALTTPAHANLKELAKALKFNKGVRLLIEGHCDNRGSNEYNLVLSERRAGSIKEFLVSEGVTAESLEVRGKGEEQPVAEGLDEVAFSKNRRGEFKKL